MCVYVCMCTRPYTYIHISLKWVITSHYIKGELPKHQLSVYNANNIVLFLFARSY